MENPLRGEKMADTHDPDTPQTGKKAGFSLGRIIPLALLAAGLAAFFIFDLNRYVSLDALKTHRETLQSWVANYGTMTAVIVP